MERRNKIVSNYMTYTVLPSTKTLLSDVTDTIYLSLRGRTFIGARIIIGTAEIKREELLKQTEGGIEGKYRSVLKSGRVYNDSMISR